MNLERIFESVLDDNDDYENPDKRTAFMAELENLIDEYDNFITNTEIIDSLEQIITLKKQSSFKQLIDIGRFS